MKSMKFTGLLVAFLVGSLFLGLVSANVILFYDDFSDMDPWELRQGTGDKPSPGLFVGENAWFTRTVEEPFSIYEVYYEILILNLNGTWGLAFLSDSGIKSNLYQTMDLEGSFSGQMLTDVVANEIVIEVQGSVTFESVMFFSKDQYGAPWLDFWSDPINNFFAVISPWAMPVGLFAFIALVAIALVFGRKGG